jgi:antitoxin (DNA-binding transcriptional repressor) of toxin-antitoxin stability system
LVIGHGLLVFTSSLRTFTPSHLPPTANHQKLDFYSYNTYFMHMQATLSELHRETRRVVRPVIHGGQEVVLTDFGRPVARIIPYLPTQTVSPDKARTGDLEDAAILAALQESRDDRSEPPAP